MKILQAIRFAPTLLLVAITAGPFPAVADPPAHYYDAAQGKSGSALRGALHHVVRGHHSLPYSSTSFDTSDALRLLDEDPANPENILGVYSHYSIVGTNIGSTTNSWNREHLWCQSYGASSGPPHTDLHHLRPESAPVNSSRGNNFYDVSAASAPGYTRYTNDAGGIVWSRTSATWEPSDADKGAIARSLFYLTVRYTGDTTGEPQLTLTDNTNLIVPGSTFMGRYTTLLKWHFAFPVTAAESNRSDQVYWLYQTNRNPFVDHPEWVAAAFLPRLRIEVAETNVLLTWTNDYTPSVVAEATMNPAGGWRVLDNAPALTSNTWTVTEALAVGPKFYRLRLQ